MLMQPTSSQLTVFGSQKVFVQDYRTVPERFACLICLEKIYFNVNI